MLRLLAFAASLVFLPSALAEVATLGEIKARNAVLLSAAELVALLPDARIVQRTVTGSTRRWTNHASGSFVASSDGFGLMMGGQYDGGTGQGTWRIDAAQGMYCVTIQWIRLREDWCRYVFKQGVKYFAFDRLGDDMERGADWEISR